MTTPLTDVDTELKEILMRLVKDVELSRFMVETKAIKPAKSFDDIEGEVEQ